MKRQKITVLVVTLAMMGVGAATTNWFHRNQKLGLPGIRGISQPGTLVMKISLPPKVLDYTSTNVPESASVVATLPKDTSFAQRRYTAPDRFWVNANIVLMGLDRTSIHKPEYCLPSQGWRIDKKSTIELPIAGPPPYRLPVAKWVASSLVEGPDGKKHEVSGLYVFWFVAHNELTTSHFQRVWWLTRDLLTTGVLQRWAYVSYFAVCEPGQEDATFERMKKLIIASVPEFQIPTSRPTSKAAPTRSAPFWRLASGKER